MLPERLSLPKAIAKNKTEEPLEVEPKKMASDSSEDETEDEFETHENL